MLLLREGLCHACFAQLEGKSIMEFAFMKFVLAVNCDIVELMLSLKVGSVLGCLELDLDVFTLVVVVAFNAEYILLYLMSAKAVGF